MASPNSSASDLITATTVPQWNWSMAQCHIWLQQFFVSRWNFTEGDAKDIAARFQGSAITLYDMDEDDWVNFLAMPGTRFGRELSIHLNCGSEPGVLPDNSQKHLRARRDDIQGLKDFITDKLAILATSTKHEVRYINSLWAVFQIWFGFLLSTGLTEYQTRSPENFSNLWWLAALGGIFHFVVTEWGWSIQKLGSNIIKRKSKNQARVEETSQ